MIVVKKHRSIELILIEYMFEPGDSNQKLQNVEETVENVL